MRVLIACEFSGVVSQAFRDRGYLRSITYQGIADAMAEQWGSLKID